MWTPVFITAGSIITVVVALVSWYEKKQSDKKSENLQIENKQLQQQLKNRMTGGSWPICYGVVITKNDVPSLYLNILNEKDSHIDTVVVEYEKAIVYPTTTAIPAKSRERINREIVSAKSHESVLVSEINQDAIAETYTFHVSWQNGKYKVIVVVKNKEGVLEYENLFNTYRASYDLSEFLEFTREHYALS